MSRIAKNKDDQPVIRDLNLKVSDVLRLLGDGQTEPQITGSHPGLQREDFLAVYVFAATFIENPWDGIRSDIKEKLDGLKVEKQH
jgi:uncharacterized protein (DUF433 family)